VVKPLAKPLAKPLVILLVAVLANALLFTAMQAMVRQDRVRLTDAEHLTIANFVRMDEPPPPEARRENKVPPKPRPDDQQRLSNLVDSVIPGSGTGVMASSLSFDFGAPSGGPGSGPATVRMASSLVTIVRVAPVYPREALMKGIEGYVDVLFTVTESGSVANPTVLAAVPAGVFEAATLAAVSRWRFQPEVRNGRPIAIPVQSRVSFTVDSSQQARP